MEIVIWKNIKFDIFSYLVVDIGKSGCDFHKGQNQRYDVGVHDLANKVIWTYLDIARPFFRIYNSENGTLEDQHYHRGSKIGLQCEVKIKRIVAKFSI